MYAWNYCCHYVKFNWFKMQVLLMYHTVKNASSLLCLCPLYSGLILSFVTAPIMWANHCRCPIIHYSTQHCPVQCKFINSNFYFLKNAVPCSCLSLTEVKAFCQCIWNWHQLLIWKSLLSVLSVLLLKEKRH